MLSYVLLLTNATNRCSLSVFSWVEGVWLIVFKWAMCGVIWCAVEICFSIDASRDSNGEILSFQVHMGTHMWSNGASRRGRRMSLDLPPIPMTPKDSEFLQRRPDLFYPYLPAPFLNGMQQKVCEFQF